MPTQSIPIGLPIPLVQNQIYALPGVSCDLFSDTTDILQVSNKLAFTPNITLVLTNGVSPIAGNFLRTTATGVTISLKKRG